MCASSSVVDQTKKFKRPDHPNAVVIERAAKPGLSVLLAKMANSVAKIVTRLPTNSSRTDCHLSTSKIEYLHWLRLLMWVCICSMNVPLTLKALIVFTPVWVSLKWEKIGELAADSISLSCRIHDTK